MRLFIFGPPTLPSAILPSKFLVQSVGKIYIGEQVFLVGFPPPVTPTYKPSNHQRVCLLFMNILSDISVFNTGSYCYSMFFHFTACSNEN